MVRRSQTKMMVSEYIVEKLRSGLPVHIQELVLFLPVSFTYARDIMREICIQNKGVYKRGVCIPGGGSSEGGVVH